MYLITYALTRYISYYEEYKTTLHYNVVDSIEKWIDSTQNYNDETYVLINFLPITDEQAKKWDGNLKSM